MMTTNRILTNLSNQQPSNAIKRPDLEHQRCPFDGAYTIEARPEVDLTYNPSNIFICPRRSFLTSQCDHPSRIRIHSNCATGRQTIKYLNCLGSWTTNGLVRLLLVDDERQRYSAWYRDYSGSLGGPHTNPADPTGNYDASIQAAVTQTPIIDLQIALLTPLPIVTKAVQVRLTRRHHCSDLLTSASSAAGQQMINMQQYQQQHQQQHQQMLNAIGLPNSSPANYYPPISAPSFSIIGNGSASSQIKLNPLECHWMVLIILLFSCSLMENFISYNYMLRHVIY